MHVNFVVVKLGLHGVPPMLLGALRFTLAALPAIFIKRPQIPFRWLFAYGITISFGQFVLLFSACPPVSRRSCCRRRRSSR